MHIYVGSLTALLQAVVLVPVMALLLLGLQRVKVKRNDYTCIRQGGGVGGNGSASHSQPIVSRKHG